MRTPSPPIAVEIVDEPFGRTRMHLRLASAAGESGEVVSELTIDTFCQWLGGEPVVMQGIGNVATPDQHRNRGFARMLVQHAVERMRAGSTALSVLYGIDGFYHRFGYASCGDEHWLELAAFAPGGERVNLPLGFDVRPATPTDQAAIVALYDTVASAVDGAVMRPAGGRTQARLADDIAAGNVRVVTDRAGAIAAYAWLGAGTTVRDERDRRAPAALALDELVALNDDDAPDAARAAIAVARSWAAELGHASVLVGVAPDDPVTRAANLVDARLTREVRPDGGMMALPLATDLHVPGGCFMYTPDRF